jgi:ribosomal protein L12E/L44/L45/RPP1/RPP2
LCLIDVKLSFTPPQAAGRRGEQKEEEKEEGGGLHQPSHQEEEQEEEKGGRSFGLFVRPPHARTYALPLLAAFQLL